MQEQEFVDRVKQIARDEYEDVKSESEDLDAGLSEKIASEVEEQLKDWDRQTDDQRKEALQDLKDQLANPQPSGGEVGTEAKQKSVFKRELKGPGSSIARAMPFMAHAAEKGSGGIEMQRVKDLAENGLPESGYQDKQVAEQVDKFLSSDQLQDGGGFVPDNQANDFIEFLYDTAVVRRAGAQSIEMPAGGIKVPVQDGSVSSEWIADNGGSATESQPSFAEKRMEAKKLATMVVLSNDLIRRSPRGVEQLVLTDMRRRALIEEDSAFILGDGQNGKPKGIYHQMAAANKFERGLDGGKVTLDSIIRDLMKSVYKVEKNNIVPQTPGWIMNPRTVRYLMTLRGSDSFPFMAQLSQGELLGAPVHMTNALPQTLDDSGDNDNDETRAFYGDFSQALIGDTLNLRAMSSQEATIKMGGNFRSMLQDDLRAVVLFHEVDFMLRHTESFAVIEGVDYGANFDS